MDADLILFPVPSITGFVAAIVWPLVGLRGGLGFWRAVFRMWLALVAYFLLLDFFISVVVGPRPITQNFVTAIPDQAAVARHLREVLSAALMCFTASLAMSLIFCSLGAGIFRLERYLRKLARAAKETP